MKSLVFVRHAKAEQPYLGQKDFNRELTTKGISDAIFKGKIILNNAENIQNIFSSPSNRTTQTAHLVAEQLGFNISKINYIDELYLSSSRKMLEIINQLNNKFSSVMIIGHNPSIEFISEYLSGNNIGHFPTSGALQISFPFEDWKLISQNTGEINWLNFDKS